MAIWNAARRVVEFFKQLVLPFGATAAVHNFNWVARALQQVLARELFVMTVNYYNDFPVLDLECASRGAQENSRRAFLPPWMARQGAGPLRSVVSPPWV